MNVKINFSENYETMFWEIDEQTTAQYNKKDKYGNYVLWQGWPVNNFSKVQIRLEKQVKDLRELVQEAVK